MYYLFQKYNKKRIKYEKRNIVLILQLYLNTFVQFILQRTFLSDKIK